MGLLSTIIGAGANLAAGLFGSKSTSDANSENAKLQKEFAQNAVQWKTADALKAGIHPLYALGAPTMSFSPSSVGDSALPNALSNMGQDIGRAIDAGGTEVDRAVRKLQLERAGLENELLKTQISSARAQLGPASPVGASSVITGQQQQAVALPSVGVIPGSPGVSAAEHATNQVGEGADIIYGYDLAKKMLMKANPYLTASSIKKLLYGTSIPNGYSVSRGRYYPGRR